MIDVERQIACSEVIEILKHLPKKDYSKLPSELIEGLEESKNPDYKFKFNTRLSLNGQDISKKARLMLAVIYRDYLASEKQREKIINFEKTQEKKIEEEAREKYNPDDIFKNRKTENIEKINENTALVVIEKENILKKLIKKIKKFFSK